MGRAADRQGIASGSKQHTQSPLDESEDQGSATARCLGKGESSLVSQLLAAKVQERHTATAAPDVESTSCTTLMGGLANASLSLGRKLPYLHHSCIQRELK